jgi:hypothetical protein
VVDGELVLSSLGDIAITAQGNLFNLIPDLKFCNFVVKYFNQMT